jgi:hypothetical protein
MMLKSTTFTTIFRVKKCHFHYMQKKLTLIVCVRSFADDFKDSTWNRIK